MSREPSLHGRTRRLLVLGLALVVVAGLVVADIVTLTKAKPSFRIETRNFQHLLAPSAASPSTAPMTTTTVLAPAKTSTGVPASP